MPTQKKAAITYASFGKSSPISIKGISSRLSDEITKATADREFNAFILLLILISSPTNIKRLVLCSSTMLSIIQEERNKPTNNN